MLDDYFRGRRILVADDDQIAVEELCDALRSAGAEIVGPAARVADAVALARTAVADCAVLTIDLDGTLTGGVVGGLRRGKIPVALAMDNVDTYPTYWTDVPRCARPVQVNRLAEALREAAAREAAGAPASPGRIQLRVTDPRKNWLTFKKTLDRNLESYAGQRRSDAQKRATRVGDRGADIPVIKLDASRWRNALDLDAALKQALGLSDRQGGSPDAWADILIHDRLNGAEPRYLIRIVGTAHCRPGLKAMIDRLAETIRGARAWKRWTYGDAVQVSFEIEP